MSDDRIAPTGYLWVCHACGKTHSDKYGIEGSGSRGWDESCMLNSGLHAIDKLIYSGDRVLQVEP